MKLSAPKQGTFIIAVLFLILAVVAKFVDSLAAGSFWLAMAGGVVLALGCYCKGL